MFDSVLERSSNQFNLLNTLSTVNVCHKLHCLINMFVYIVALLNCNLFNVFIAFMLLTGHQEGT